MSKKPSRYAEALLISVATGVLFTASACAPQHEEAKVPPSPTAAQRCEALASTPISGLRVLRAEARPAGFAADFGFGGMKSPPLPAHCEITGILHERTGQDGEPYAIRFHLRMPEDWNGRMLFEGGGGTDGNLGTALGMIGFRAPPAIMTGYAVVGGDSGHSNEINNDPAKGGQASFGRDAEARADYGHAALKATYDAARTVMARYYDKAPAHTYYAGCSKGGQEGLAFAERYPDAFDGILVGAPGMSLPRAALGHPWSAQAFAAAAGARKGKSIPIERLQSSYSDADLLLARKAVLDACDGDDGLKDGIIGTFASCSTKKVASRLNALICESGKTDACLTGAQVDGILKFYAGPRNSKGDALYVSFPWDGGIGSADWRGWNIGSPAKPGMPPMMSGAGGPPVSVTMGAATLATIFSTPPKVLEPGVQPALDYLLAFDFDKDAPAIYATSAIFPRSSWEDINARSPDLDAFRKHGGKLIVYHGASDPVFSINDTIAWYSEADARMGGEAADTVRLFPVPGMGHCQSGPATDQFDGFGALLSWVEKGTPPDRIVAAANPAAPWPNRERPLCPYPAIAQYDGKGDIEKAASFVCVVPKAPK
jgi:feruloyl esterase